MLRVLLLIALALPLPALAQLRWQEGRHYIKLPAQQTAESRPGKIEVAEVFSYGCIHCYRAQADVEKLKAALPPDAYLTYVHASFMPAEAWPMYQRAWYTAQTLGIGEANHHRMFSAVWETGEVALLDKATQKVRRPLPTIQEAARFYARTGKVTEAQFLKTATSPAVNALVARADQLVSAWRVNGTPSFVVNGRYLINNDVVSSWSDIQGIILLLVAQERQRLKAPAAQPPAYTTPVNPANPKPSTAKP
jgi:protein dithiol oxidoreductase (disulfide-forming)